MTSSTTFTTASFFTSFNSNKRRPSLGLPTSPLNRSFLQSPLWNTITTTTKPDRSLKKKEGKQSEQQQQLQQAIYVLPKSPSHVSIYLQLPAFRSLSVMMRCGHVSRLVENWLCNPMDQLKRNAERAFDQKKPITRKRSSSLCILPKDTSSLTGPSSVVNNHTIVPYQKNPFQPVSSLFIHFQQGQQSQPMEIQYSHIPCLFTIVCVTYHCGSVSVSINQIESLDFLSSTARMNPFLIKCDLLPNHPVTIHQLTTVPQICDYAEPVPTIIEEVSQTQPVTICRPEDPTPVQPYVLDKPFIEMKNVELLHIKETILYQEEDDDDDDESWLYSSSEEFSVLEDDTEEEMEPEKDAAQVALLRLVQDTLEYIQSSGGALSDELNQLEYKLYNYSRAHQSVYN